MPKKDVRPVLRVGCFAYLDSFVGMVPCKVLSITGKSGAASTMQRVTLQVTATRGAYKRGDALSVFGHRAVPRAAFYKRKLGAGIGYYTVEVS